MEICNLGNGVGLRAGVAPGLALVSLCIVFVATLGKPRNGEQSGS